MDGQQYILYLNEYKLSNPGWILSTENKQRKKLNPVNYIFLRFLLSSLSIQDYVVCPELTTSQWKYWNKDQKEFTPYYDITGSFIKCAV